MGIEEGEMQGESAENIFHKIEENSPNLNGNPSTG
jgi:hypothetical protein